MSWKLFLQLLILIFLFWGIIHHLMRKTILYINLHRSMRPKKLESMAVPFYKSSDDDSTS